VDQHGRQFRLLENLSGSAWRHSPSWWCLFREQIPKSR
jgi:hypothetical protein